LPHLGGKIQSTQKNRVIRHPREARQGTEAGEEQPATHSRVREDVHLEIGSTAQEPAGHCDAAAAGPPLSVLLSFGGAFDRRGQPSPNARWDTRNFRLDALAWMRPTLARRLEGVMSVRQSRDQCLLEATAVEELGLLHRGIKVNRLT
jgi:hypothetical protein